MRMCFAKVHPNLIVAESLFMPCSADFPDAFEMSSKSVPTINLVNSELCMVSGARVLKREKSGFYNVSFWNR